MDAVILAAGKGTRLNGVAAPYHKPLMVVNGQPLIVNAVGRAEAHAGFDGQVVVVVAPENALPISQVLGTHEVTMLVQREARGPGDALYRGALVANSDRILVLMGDNTLSHVDLTAVLDTGVPTVGVQRMGVEEAERFTFRRGDGRWVEGETIDDTDTDFGCVTVWCGPLVLDRDRTIAALGQATRAHGNREVKIGPWLNGILGEQWTTVETSTFDIGTPEALVR